ncbi:MAG: hypothetical protein PHC66_02880 [Candidatus Nanoarchaeia archaeon]|nr:hypothetical protein [Candidatus Nanoarchaeia archaeon]MDD5239007.1 hypothetical protein [Candidatus Nanoarchaeia archaeon]
MKFDEIKKFAKEYYSKNKLDGKFETDKFNEGAGIYCGDNLTDGFFMEYSGKEPDVVFVYSAFFLHREMNSAAAKRIAEKAHEEFGIEVNVQHEGLKPQGAKFLKHRYRGQLDVLSYTTIAYKMDELEQAANAVLTCRNKHPKKIHVLDIMKKMPAWQDFLKQEYGSD